jgi:alpha-amylase
VTARIALSLVLHNHQPVGNFGWVIEDVWTRAYAPFIAALEAHPHVRVGLHYSGPLLDWMEQERPDAIERLAALTARGQVEMLGGGLTEPILASLPLVDRQAQLVQMGDAVQRLFGVRPRGAWLAERVWEPSLASDLVAGGYAYTVLDDNHLRAARVPEDAMWSTYSTDDQGRRLTIFGTEQGLRYRIPWKPVRDLMRYLRAHATETGERVGVMGDDGEKFGAWPGTHDYCWGKEGWIEQLLLALAANADWLSTVRPSDWMDAHVPGGRIYVPTSSYVEMTEWALPADEAPVFHELLDEARAQRSQASRFLFGAIWRGFQARYREVNDLHKQMLRTSAAVAAMPPGPVRDRAHAHLLRGQSNDAYWHGLFGGVYLVHLRLATLSHLIAAEDLADGGTPPTRLEDLDLDGVDEVLLGAPGQLLAIDVAEGAGIGSWDLRASRAALASVLRRRPEAYHRQLRAHFARQDATAARKAAGILSPHETVTLKDEGLRELLVYDRHELRGALVELRELDAAPGIGPTELAGVMDEEIGDFVEAPFEVIEMEEGRVVVRRRGHVRSGDAAAPLTVTKTFVLSGDRLRPELAVKVSLVNRGRKRSSFELDLSFAWNVAGGGHNPDAWYAWSGAGVEGTSPHDVPGDLAKAEGLAFGSRSIGLEVTAELNQPGRITWFPVETVSNSEAGFERIYQGSSLHLRWPIQLSPGADAVRSVRFVATQSRDLTAQEARPRVASRPRVGADPTSAAPSSEPNRRPARSRGARTSAARRD